MVRCLGWQKKRRPKINATCSKAEYLSANILGVSPSPKDTHLSAELESDRKFLNIWQGFSILWNYFTCPLKVHFANRDDCWLVSPTSEVTHNQESPCDAINLGKPSHCSAAGIRPCIKRSEYAGDKTKWRLEAEWTGLATAQVVPRDKACITKSQNMSDIDNQMYDLHACAARLFWTTLNKQETKTLAACQLLSHYISVIKKYNLQGKIWASQEMMQLIFIVYHLLYSTRLAPHQPVAATKSCWLAHCQVLRTCLGKEMKRDGTMVPWCTPDLSRGEPCGCHLDHESRMKYGIWLTAWLRNSCTGTVCKQWTIQQENGKWHASDAWNNISWTWVFSATLHRFRCQANGYNLCSPGRSLSATKRACKSLFQKARSWEVHRPRAKGDLPDTLPTIFGECDLDDLGTFEWYRDRASTHRWCAAADAV